MNVINGHYLGVVIYKYTTSSMPSRPANMSAGWGRSLLRPTIVYVGLWGSACRSSILAEPGGPLDAYLSSRRACNHTSTHSPIHPSIMQPARLMFSKSSHRQHTEQWQNGRPTRTADPRFVTVEYSNICLIEHVNRMWILKYNFAPCILRTFVVVGCLLARPTSLSDSKKPPHHITTDCFVPWDRLLGPNEARLGLASTKKALGIPCCCWCWCTVV